ncbi:MAG: flagellin, partial [Planctomycetaceae bacterium]|nr:flagellin [Planctomycetaceae bacterium]
MTRINTNLSSLVGQNILSRNQASLQVNLTRLSTGLRINSGKDDPAGLIASEVLGRELTATNVSIKNTERANNIVATADAALKEVSSLLNDIRGLVQSAANKGATSSAEIASNQVQVDSALDTITRIAQTTVFGGDKLLNGAKGFSVSATGGSLGAFRSSADLTISSFDPSVHTSSAGDDVTIAVTAAATKKSVVFTGADAVLGNSATLADLSSSSTKASRTISGAALASIAGSGANTVTFNVTGNVGTTAVTVNIDAVQADSAVLRDAINAVTATTGVIAAGTGAGANVTVTSTTLGSSGIATISATSATSSTAT